MVFIQWPTELTDEEKAVQRRYEQMRKWKKSVQTLLANKTVEKLNTKQNTKIPLKRGVSDALGATEEAKKLVKSGAMTIAKKYDDKHTFKRKKLKDGSIDQSRDELNYQPLLQRHNSSMSSTVGSSSARPHFDGDEPHSNHHFSPGSGMFLDQDPQQSDAPIKGKTIYVRGFQLHEDGLRKQFDRFGTLTRVFVELPRQRSAFLTYQTVESADRAIKEMNGNMILGGTVRVSFARKQFIPGDNKGWSKLAAESSEQDRTGSDYFNRTTTTTTTTTKQSSRDVVSYDDDDIVY